MDEREIAYAIGWLLVASGALVVVLANLTRYGYRATAAGLLLGFVGLLIAGPHLGGCGRALADARPVRVLSLSPLQGSALRAHSVRFDARSALVTPRGTMLAHGKPRPHSSRCGSAAYLPKLRVSRSPLPSR